MTDTIVILLRDEIGATYDGKPTFLNYRIIVERGQFYGVENLRKRFGSDSDWLAFLKVLVNLPEGSVDNITWKREK